MASEAKILLITRLAERPSEQRILEWWPNVLCDLNPHSLKQRIGALWGIPDVDDYMLEFEGATLAGCTTMTTEGAAWQYVALSLLAGKIPKVKLKQKPAQYTDEG